MKRLYVRVVRLVGAVLGRLGILGLLERLGRRSRTALWVRSWFAVYDLDGMLSVGVPWWTFAAVDRVEEFLAERPDARVLEWGSGVSTVWLAGRTGQVVSVEHDAEWAESMKPHLPSNVTLKLVEPVASATPVVGSQKPGFEGLDFADYVAAGSTHGRADLVVVDGRAREACLPVALDALAADGLVVLDNVDRRRYRDALAAYDDRVEVEWTRGRTPSLPYPTRTALIRLRTR